MPGYEPFLLCDFHVHTRWSDGRLTLARGGRSLRIDGQVRRDRDHRSHSDEERPAGTGGSVRDVWPSRYGVREDTFDAYLADIRQGSRARARQYGMLVIPGAEITQNRIRGRKNSHIIALDIKKYISADQTADDDPA